MNHASYLIVTLVLALCALLPAKALACSYGTYAQVKFATPSDITLPPGLQDGTRTLLWSSAPTRPFAPALTSGCDNQNIQYGIYNFNTATAPGASVTLYKTTVTNLAYAVLRNGQSVAPYEPGNTIPGDAGSFNVPYVLQFYATGPITTQNVSIGQIGQIYAKFPGAAQTVIVSLQLSGGPVTLQNPTCSIPAPGNTHVRLPVVSTSSFDGVTSVAGETSFDLTLQCPASSAGSAVSITLATNAPQAGATGVIEPRAGNGYASGVGVQLLDENGDAIAFDQATPVGTVTAGTFKIPLKTRYYQTGSTVSAGTVEATATYTLTYQ